MQRDRFRRIVQRALAGLPAEFSDRMENVEVVIRREPGSADRNAGTVEPDEELFGLYVGTPQPSRGDYQMVLPDRITIFQGPHERAFPPEALIAEVRRTVVHEVAHHFGIDDDRLEALGLG
jgi:predicted Zn-dependent protease with MMP-like domain